MNEALPVLYERHGEQVAVITLNRPEKNAINLQMAELIRTTCGRQITMTRCTQSSRRSTGGIFRRHGYQRLSSG